MPPSGYLSAAGIESCLQYLANTYPSICQLITMPEQSIEGRTSRAIKIGKGGDDHRHGALLIGGVHARELVNPDLLVSFALKLCDAYTNGTGLTFGGKSYGSGLVRIVVESMDTFIFPLVNPDGRVHVQSPSGYAMWRKNRNPNPGQPCMGVDINRNYDFLWSSGIGTSSNSCSDVFKGASAFSEPETRNVRHMLDTHSNIGCMMDVHSYSELILYPWGDDDNQTTDPSMNFQNSGYDGLRGNPGDSVYREYIPAQGLDWFEATGIRMRDAIQAVRGRVYQVQQGVLLYPTTGTSEDYAYARHFVDTGNRHVNAFTLETGNYSEGFQPGYADAVEIIKEGSAGVMEFLLACLCVVEETSRGRMTMAEMNQMRGFRDRELTASSAGRKYLRTLQIHAMRLLEIASRDKGLRGEAIDLLRSANEVIQSQQEAKSRTFDADIIGQADGLIERTMKESDEALRDALKDLRKDLRHFRGRTAEEGLQRASRPSTPTKSKSAPKKGRGKKGQPARRKKPRK